jgi:hypothetical protein
VVEFCVYIQILAMNQAMANQCSCVDFSIHSVGSIQAFPCARRRPDSQMYHKHDRGVLKYFKYQKLGCTNRSRSAINSFADTRKKKGRTGLRQPATELCS